MFHRKLTSTSVTHYMRESFLLPCQQPPTPLSFLALATTWGQPGMGFGLVGGGGLDYGDWPSDEVKGVNGNRGVGGSAKGWTKGRRGRRENKEDTPET
ncbi:hypothetical protein EYF80_029580 [Liparis tanakae]|uniref:Uncharacterized protein n=1 Tax=Liparis tanakae TaxID=230148 RepID=A0A4Z2H4M9_9TELE|nr:hypothetical protein EYF80_029580 [Liparis tanakae]